MRKKILLFGFAAIALIGTFIALYKSFGSETVAMTRKVDTVDSVITQSIKLSEISEFSKQNPGDHVFLIRDGKADSDYVIDTVLTPLKKELKEKPIPNIVSVDMSDAENTTVTRLKNMFTVEAYPAFVYATYNVDTNSLDVKSSVVYNTKKPMTIAELRKWFFDNGLWKGPYKA